ncbi:hypothetical protein WA026_016167 [Henosepilachna vigintioctopunctata]|uniref:Uncharacterized protein n=1 Tax=Henosepilachna vigintioctopunctata TaxID=420089 RepID=A0AAW1TUL4_9CUCU
MALREKEIEQFFIENDDDLPQESDSEIENQLLEDDVATDTKDELVLEIVDAPDSPTDAVASNHSEESTVDVNLSLDPRIVTPSQRTLRDKNRCFWATSKGRSRSRTSSRILFDQLGDQLKCAKICMIPSYVSICL